jgi:hypothetical protein
MHSLLPVNLAWTSDEYQDLIVRTSFLRGAAVQTDGVASIAVGASVIIDVNNGLATGLSQAPIDRSREELL